MNATASRSTAAKRQGFPKPTYGSRTVSIKPVAKRWRPTIQSRTYHTNISFNDGLVKSPRCRLQARCGGEDLICEARWHTLRWTLGNDQGFWIRPLLTWKYPLLSGCRRPGHNVLVRFRQRLGRLRASRLGNDLLLRTCLHSFRKVL